MRWATLLLLLANIECAGASPPVYTRLSGAAPTVAPRGAALLVFWAPWCEPCVEEVPALRKLAQSSLPPLQIVIVDLDTSLDAAQSYFSSSVQIRLDPNEEIARAFAVTALPTAVLIRGGALLARFDGKHAWGDATMRQLLERLIID